MNRPEFEPNARPAGPARRRRPVLRLWPEAPALPRLARGVEPRVERIAALALVDRALIAPRACVPLSRAARHALYGPSAAQEASRLPSAPAGPALLLDVRALAALGAFGEVVPVGAGAALRLPPWMTRVAPYPGQPAGEVCWGGGTFRPWSAGAGRRGQADAAGEPPITTLEVREVREVWPAASGATPGRGPAGAVYADVLADAALGDAALGVYVERTACGEAAEGHALHIRACRFRHADYPHADVDEYVVTAAWALGAGGEGPWLALAGRSYTRAGQEALLAAVRTLRRD